MSLSSDLLRARFLLIDDDEDVADLLCMSAEEMGIEVRICNNFDAVEPIIEQYIPDIIFLTLRLPRHDGIEVLHLLAKKHCRSRIYLISDMDQTILDSVCRIGLQLKLDIAGSFRKPFAAEDIEGHLSSDLDKRSRFSSENFQSTLGPGEFVINYHPIIVVSSDRESPIIGVEVRPHWTNKHGSKVWLSQIILQIRKHKLLQEFNFLLMDKALESYCEWLKSDLDLSITVGMDESNLTDPAWPDLLINVVDKWNVPHNRITIAIEQQAMKNNIYPALSALTRLRINKFNIALESMGTDIEELDELLHIPFSELRLKRVLVNQIGKDMEAEFNVSTLISLAKKRNINTCAVGVKTPEAFSFLQDCGCATATGSLFGESLPVTEVESVIRCEMS